MRSLAFFICPKGEPSMQLDTIRLSRDTLTCTLKGHTRNSSFFSFQDTIESAYFNYVLLGHYRKCAFGAIKVIMSEIQVKYSFLVLRKCRFRYLIIIIAINRPAS